jgi:hypothetical protein
MINIFLDDERKTPPGFVRTYTVQDTFDLLSGMNGRVGILSLDNDLGSGIPWEEGQHVVTLLAERALDGKPCWPQSIRIHTANPVARDSMKRTIERYAPHYRWDWHGQAYVDDRYEEKRP